MERLDPKHQRVRLHILEASMNALGDNDGVDGLLAHSLEIGGLLLDRCLVQDVCCRVAAGDRGGRTMRFREEPVTPVYRHWMCEQVGCNGELLSTGESITRLSTSWKHRCGKCGHEDWADATYPRVAYLPMDAIGPDDSYT